MKKSFSILALLFILSPSVSFADPLAAPQPSLPSWAGAQTPTFNGTGVSPTGSTQPQPFLNGSGPLSSPGGATTGGASTGGTATQGSSGADTPITPATDSTTSSARLGLVCDWDTMSDCIALLPYWLLYIPTSWFLAFGGMLFDAFTAYSLSSTVINANFVHTGWTAVRDVSNIVFIFILLYIAIKTILGLGDWKKPIGMIIVTALLINFSLFFTQVMIDASNLVAYQFYNLIGSGSEAVRTDGAQLGFQAHSISTRIISSINPQSLMGADLFKAWGASGKGVGQAIIIFIAAAVINVAFAVVFFWAGFLMLGRLIMFWMLMIASPIAFIGLVLPKANEIVGGSWWGKLTSQLLVAPVFLFFLYILTFILGKGGLFG